MISATYPEWHEVKDEISKEELLEIIDYGLEVGLDEAIKEYIEANYCSYEEYEEVA